MIRAIIFFIAGAILYVAMDLSLRTWNPYVLCIWSAMLAASIVYIIMSRPRKIKRLKANPKPELSDTVIVSLSQPERDLVALALLNLGMLIGKDSYDPVTDMSIKLGVHKEMNKLMKEMLDKLRSNNNP